MKNIPGTEYIIYKNSHGYDYYNVQRWINGKCCFLGSGKTLIQALMIRDWCEANNWSKYPKQSKTSEKYISQNNNGTYQVQKRINGKYKYYGGFKTLEEAIKYRDFIVKKGWSSNHIYTDPLKYIQKLDNGSYHVNIYHNQKMHHIGTFESLEDAIEQRDLFLKYDGDWDLICEDFNGEEEYLTGKLSHNTFFESKDKRNDFFNAKNHGIVFRASEEL